MIIYLVNLLWEFLEELSSCYFYLMKPCLYNVHLHTWVILLIFSLTWWWGISCYGIYPMKTILLVIFWFLLKQHNWHIKLLKTFCGSWIIWFQEVKHLSTNKFIWVFSSLWCFVYIFLSRQTIYLFPPYHYQNQSHAFQWLDC